MKTYNKGEWSEPYLLLKLIVDQQLNIGTDNFEKVEGIFYRIVKILHHEKTKSTEFTFDGNLVIIRSSEESFKVPIKHFVKICKSTLAKISAEKSRKGSFAIPELIDFLKTINITEVKAKSTLKNDITIQFEDPKTFISPTLGFSIKSQLGRPSTLLNASGATKFVYTISRNLSELQISQLENQKLFSEKFRLLEEFGVDIKYEDVLNPKFKINLQSIDYNFPKILSDIVLLHYKNDDSKKNQIIHFAEEITSRNEFKYDLELNSEIYQMIIKRFLVEYALGMKADEIWKRDFQADGGYLVIREDGEVVCYHFYFIKQFENYLFKNTKLETPSKRRYKMTEIYEENGQQKFTLTLQVRFIK